VWIDGDKASMNDDLAATINYAELAKLLVENAKSEPVDLLETLASRLLDVVMNLAGGDVTGVIQKPRSPFTSRPRQSFMTSKMFR